MNRKRLETYEWINTAACLDTLEARTDLTEDEVQWLLNRIDFLGTPAEVSIARMKELYSGTQKSTAGQAAQSSGKARPYV